MSIYLLYKIFNFDFILKLLFSIYLTTFLYFSIENKKLPQNVAVYFFKFYLMKVLKNHIHYFHQNLYEHR